MTTDETPCVVTFRVYPGELQNDLLPGVTQRVYQIVYETVGAEVNGGLSAGT